MLIRDELPSDETAIAALIAAAFRDMPYSHQTEAFIMAALRRAGALTVSLVAEEAGHIVGQAAFSPVEIDGKPSRLVRARPDRRGARRASAPASAAPSSRRASAACIGSAPAAACWSAIPAYYRRFGFRNEPRLTLDGVPPEVFMILPLGKTVPEGKVAFHPAFAATA